MKRIEDQARQDAMDAHQGASVCCPYCHRTQERQYNEWCIAFNRKKLELEGVEK